MEYQKIWNGVTITSVVALCVLTVVFAIVTLNSQLRTIDKNGNIVYGLPSFRALKEAAKDVEGTMDGKFIQELIEKYDSSFDKKYLEENRGFLGTGGMTKYIVTNYVINYAYYGAYMSNGNDKIGLDYKFLDSEDSFYQKYKEAVKEHKLYVNELNGLFPYSAEQVSVLENKIEKIKTPFRVEYRTGLASINSYHKMEYPVFFILLAFCLSSIYAKDSNNGMDELILSSKYGRKKDMRARWIAGNLFTISAYLIFVGLLIIVHGSIASLHGLNASIQTMFFDSLYNINIGMGLLIIFFGGLLGVLVVANFVMFLSMKIKNSKVTTLAAIVMVVLLVRQTSTYSQIKLFNPIQFIGSELVVDYLFIGKMAVPHVVIVFLLASMYITVFQLFMKQSYKKYRIN